MEKKEFHKNMMKQFDEYISSGQDTNGNVRKFTEQVRERMKIQAITDNLRIARQNHVNFINSLNKCGVLAKYKNGELHLYDTENKKKIIIKE